MIQLAATLDQRKFGLGGWFIDKFFGSWLAESRIYNLNYKKKLLKLKLLKKLLLNTCIF